MAKIIHIDDLPTLVKSLEGKNIVTTNGVFDQFHRGHLDYLRKSKGLGDVLIIGVNSDNSVTVNKGPGKPLNDAFSRMDVLSGLECVDYIFEFDALTPNAWLELVKPKVHCKGLDYTLGTLHEREVVERNGGRIELISFLKYQTTFEQVKFFNEEK